jgi:hypothetical protein
MHSILVPPLVHTMNAIAKVLAKGEAFAAERKIDPAVLLDYRLAPDMFALTRQVQVMSDTAKGAAARLAGVEVPKYEDTEKTFAELKARIDKTVAFMQGLKPQAFDGADTRDVTVPIGGKPTVFKGLDYLNGSVFPNFYFHATTAYAILRHCGVAIGKRDFLGRA